jgi:RimJ/RimL family protein N-acetyltransferase
MNDHLSLYELHRDPAVTRFAGGSKNRQESLASLERMMERVNQTGFGPLALTERQAPGSLLGESVIGWCGVQPLRGTTHYEVIYALAPRFWGRGYATEAAAALIHTAFSSKHLPKNEIVGLVYPQNIPSICVLQKLGMDFKKYIYVSESRRHASLYSCGESSFLEAYARLLI